MKRHPETTDDMISIFTAALTGGESNRQLAAKLIRRLTPEAKRDLRASIQDLDYLMDDVFLEQLREKRIAKRNE
jgi:hypothetical protein